VTEASGKAIFPVEDISEKTKHVVPQQQGKKSLNVKKHTTNNI